MQNNIVDLKGGTCFIVIENIYHLLFDDNIKSHGWKKQIEMEYLKKNKLSLQWKYFCLLHLTLSMNIISNILAYCSDLIY